jgi:TolB-like protein/DNA-binding winged helix-turn-helix (wHTH) protein/tetratricopeptide (TPR) repeat protein
MDKRSAHYYEFGPFRLIPRERQLLRDEQNISLTPKAFDLLLALVEEAGHLVRKDELLVRVWAESFVEEANLSVKMSEVRRALGERKNEQKYIETVPRLGYRFVADVTEHDETVDQAEVDSETGPLIAEPVAFPLVPEQVEESRRVLSYRPAAAIAIAVCVLGITLFAFDVGSLRTRLFGKAPVPDIRSVAVMPLENHSGDPSQDYFADGMTEALITELAKIRALRVISRASVMQYKGEKKSLTQIGNELKVEAILTGSVMKSGDRVRVSVQLIDVAHDTNLWTDSYEHDIRDVLELQREVTRDIVAEIRIKLSPKEEMQFGKASPVNPVAYDHFLRGKFFLYRQTAEDNERAVEALERSVAADESFAAAHAELAQAYVWKLFLFARDEKALAQKAYISAEKALALDPELAVAYLARGRLLWTPANRFPHGKAIKEYRRALELNPNLDEARNQLALVLNHVGAFDEAMRELEKAVETNPSNSLAQFRIAETLLFQGKYEPALASLRAVPNDANPALVGHQIVWALFNLGRKDEAQATLDHFLKEFPDDNRGLLTSLQAVFAATDEQDQLAEDKIEQAIEKGKGFGHFHHTAYHIACAYARMGKVTEAVNWLEKVAEEGFPCYPMFERDPNLQGLRGNQAFEDFLTRQRALFEEHKKLL